jgi:3,4-dehydroadipyl-CoA semialdehyde dehydrogenase
MTLIPLKSYLNGQWVEGTGNPVFLHNPTTGEVLAQTSSEGLDFSSALEYARKQGGPQLKALTFKERASLLEKMSNLLHEHRERWIDIALRNAGNTRKDAKFDLDGATATLSAYAEIGKTLGERIFLTEEEVFPLGRNPRFAGQHLLVPLTGVAVHINAFNFPAWGFAEKAAQALLAGVPIVVKPATSTALLTYRMVELLIEQNTLPQGALSLVCGPIGDLLNHLNSQDFVVFTGSSETGLHIKQHPQLLRQNIRVNIEADSLNSIILGPDVEEDCETYHFFLQEVLREMTAKSGQKCTAVRRIFVPQEKIDKVQEDLCKGLAERMIGDPQHKEVHLGPLATQKQVESVKAGVRELEKHAKRIYGNPDHFEIFGGGLSQTGYFFPPLLFRADSPSTATEVHSCEVFGPVATLLPYPEAETEALIQWVQAGGGSLVCSLFSEEKNWIRQLTLALAPYHGRILIGTEKIAELSTGHGTVLPQLVHGGPGRAGGGEELGGLRGLSFYFQRTAIQGYRPLLESLFKTSTLPSSGT